MNKLQRNLILDIIFWIGLLAFIVICGDKNPDLLYIVTISLLLLLLSIIVLYILSILLSKIYKDYLIRGMLDEDEYRLYKAEPLDIMFDDNLVIRKHDVGAKVDDYLETHSKLSKFVNKYL